MRGREDATEVNRLSLQDMVAAEGGPVDLKHPPLGLSPETAVDASVTLAFLAKVFLHNLPAPEKALYVMLTQSSGLSCRARQVEDGVSVIFVPAGLIGRIRALCRALLRYWNKETHISLISSPLDKIPEDQWEVPPRLRPLFDDKLSGQEFWTGLQELDASLDLDPAFEPDVLELMHLGLVFLLAHEFAHVSFRHFDFVKQIRQTQPAQLARIRRGLELHADSFAGTWATAIFLGQISGETDRGSLARGFMRQSYAVTVIMSMFDAHKKFVGFYDEGDYNHPLIRREVCACAMRNQVSLRGKEFMDFWQVQEVEGWKRAVEALTDLNLDSVQGKFGQVTDFTRAASLSALNYGMGASFPILEEMLKEANELIEDVKAQLTAFNKNSSTPETQG